LVETDFALLCVRIFICLAHPFQKNMAESDKISSADLSGSKEKRFHGARVGDLVVIAVEQCSSTTIYDTRNTEGLLFYIEDGGSAIIREEARKDFVRIDDYAKIHLTIKEEQKRPYIDRNVAGKVVAAWEYQRAVLDKTSTIGDSIDELDDKLDSIVNENDCTKPPALVVAHIKTAQRLLRWIDDCVSDMAQELYARTQQRFNKAAQLIEVPRDSLNRPKKCKRNDS
jgi:hypothetical protein